MTHDEFNALPTADKIAVRKADLRECIEQLDTLSGKAAYFRALAERFGEQAETAANRAAVLTGELDNFRSLIAAEKAAARAFKRTTGTTETPVETPQ